jgi:hypothetical protein
MAVTTAPTPSAPARWAVATVLGYLSDEADYHAEIAKRLRDVGDVNLQKQIIYAIKTIQDMAATNFPS